jgi:hypothetical protein
LFCENYVAAVWAKNRQFFGENILKKLQHRSLKTVLN